MAEDMNTRPTIETVLERINSLSEHVDERINSLSGYVDERINALSEHMDTRFNLSDTSLERIDARLDRLQGAMLDLRADFKSLRMQVKERIPDLPDLPRDLLES
jgi:DNA anti-recombination protein RmuC